MLGRGGGVGGGGLKTEEEDMCNTFPVFEVIFWYSRSSFVPLWKMVYPPMPSKTVSLHLRTG